MIPIFICDKKHFLLKEVAERHKRRHRALKNPIKPQRSPVSQFISVCYIKNKSDHLFLTGA